MERSGTIHRYSLSFLGLLKQGRHYRELESQFWIDAVSKNEGKTTSQICASLGKGADDKGLQNARKNALASKLVKTNSVGSAVTWWLIGSIMPTQQTIESAS